MEKKIVGILLIATNKYKQFVQPLLDGIDKNFLREHQINVFLFTDEISPYKTTRINIIQTQIPPYKFPEATLYRYKIFDEHSALLKSNDYLYYLDVDMAIVSEVGEEIFSDGLTVTQHPGFFNGGWGSNGNSKESLSYLPIDKRVGYYAGGFQGGTSNVYLTVCNILNARIQDDENRGVQAEWQDETHWNWITHEERNQLYKEVLTPSYCMVEDVERRKAWGIDHLEPKIIALNKNHAEIRA